MKIMKKSTSPKSRATCPWFKMTDQQVAAWKAADLKARQKHAAKVFRSRDPMAAIKADVKAMQASVRAHVKATVTPACEAELVALEEECDADRRVEHILFLHVLRHLNDAELAYLQQAIGIRSRHSAGRPAGR